MITMAKRASLWILAFTLLSLTSADETGKSDENAAKEDEGKKHVHLWNYDKQGGPGRWDKIYPDRCGVAKKRQSPVNINTSTVKYEDTFNNIDIVYQNSSENKMTVVNNGHTVKVKINGLVNIVGGGLGDSFKIFQFHFHWGGADSRGSEHRINDKTYPLELHMVSYDSNRYVSVKEALGGFNSLAVLGTLFDVVEEDNPVFSPIINVLDQITHKGQEVQIDWIEMTSMIPEQTGHFFRYDGSLTTPPCLENVIWTVFASQQKISKTQLNKFRDLFQEGDDEEEIPLMDNFRPPQALHGRQIYSSFQPKTITSESASAQDNYATTIVTSSVCMILGIVMSLVL